VSLLDNFTDDGEGDLFGPFGTDIQPDGSVQARQIAFLPARLLSVRKSAPPFFKEPNKPIYAMGFSNPICSAGRSIFRRG
jgi:hypothetical protein